MITHSDYDVTYLHAYVLYGYLINQKNEKKNSYYHEEGEQTTVLRVLCLTDMCAWMCESYRTRRRKIEEKSLLTTTLESAKKEREKNE